MQTALHWAGLGTIASVGLALVFRLPNVVADLSPGIHARVPAILGKMNADDEAGPVLVSVEYTVQPDRQAEFEKLMKRYRFVRRRDGASRWEMFRDVQKEDHYLEVFSVHFWAEHLRQHERLTKTDEELESQIRACTAGEPIVRHLLYASES